MQESQAAGKNLIDQLRPYVSILLFISKNQNGETEVVNNATASFIDTGEKKIIATCAHVIEKYREKKEDDPNLSIALGLPSHDNSFVELPDNTLIECGNSKAVDLATFSLSDPELIHSYNKQYFRLSFPLERPRRGDTIGVVVYPGDQREVEMEKIKATINALSITIDAISDQFITSADEDQTRLLVSINNQPNLTFGTFAGMSGSAGYKITMNSEVSLIGFLAQATTESGYKSVIKFVHADFLKPDGTIDWEKVCW